MWEQTESCTARQMVAYITASNAAYKVRHFCRVVHHRIGGDRAVVVIVMGRACVQSPRSDSDGDKDRSETEVAPFIILSRS